MTRAIFTFRDAPAIQGATSPTQDLSGKAVTGASRLTFNVSANYYKTLTDRLDGYAVVSYGYKSGFYGYIDDSSYSWIKPVGLTDARVDTSYENGLIDVSLWVKSAFDQRYFNMITPLAAGSGGYFSNIGAPGVSTPADKVAGPNEEVICGAGWLDLTAEPQILSVPDSQGRWYSLELMDAYQNSFNYVSSRATSTKAGLSAIVGPNWHGTLPDGVKPIASPANAVAILTRIGVNDESDAPAALALQAGYDFTPLSANSKFINPLQVSANPLRLYPIPHPATLGASFFDELSAGLALYPPPASDQAFVDSLERDRLRLKNTKA